MKHWHRCSRWWKAGLECPYSSLVQHEEEEQGGGEGDDEVKAKEVPEAIGPPAIPIDEPVQVEDGEAFEDEVLDQMEEAFRDLPKVIPIKKGEKKDEQEDTPDNVPTQVPVEIPAPPQKPEKERVTLVRRTPIPVRVDPVGDLSPLIKKVAKPTPIRSVVQDMFELPTPPPRKTKARSRSRVKLAREDFLEAQEGFKGLTGAYATSVVKDFVPDDVEADEQLMQRLRGPVKVPKRGRFAFVPKTRIPVQEVKSANVRAGLSEEAVLQAMELGIRKRIMANRRRKFDRLRGFVQKPSVIAGAAAAGAAGAGGFFFNARKRLKGLLQ